jgi:heme exporter protein CcmD
MTESHWGFILAAYAVTALVIGGMAVKILLDYRRLQQELGTMTGAKIAGDDAS